MNPSAMVKYWKLPRNHSGAWCQTLPCRSASGTQSMDRTSTPSAATGLESGWFSVLVASAMVGASCWSTLGDVLRTASGRCGEVLVHGEPATGPEVEDDGLPFVHAFLARVGGDEGLDVVAENRRVAEDLDQ